MGAAWEPLIRQATEGLLAGRFGRCERLAAGAAAAGPGQIGPALLAVVACREQGRATEAELMLRDLAAQHPGDDQIRVTLAAVLADLGRDAEAGRHLERVDLDRASLDVCALAAEASAVLRLRPVAEALHSRIAPHRSTFAGIHGSLARHLGLLAHVLGDWHAAAAHYDVALAANREAGAPVLVAHTCRHYSAVLRLRGDDGDWDRAVELLAEAADIYRGLEIASRAEEAQAILRRSLDAFDVEGFTAAGGGHAFRRTATGWALSFGGRSADVAEDAGLGHIARLLAAAGRPFHVLELAETQSDHGLRALLGAECRSRLLQLAGRGAPDPVAAALARAEQDRLEAELAVLDEPTSTPGQIVDRARRLVSIRIRGALERLDHALPDLGRHLRRSVRTGTFCSYDPVQLQRWTVRP